LDPIPRPTVVGRRQRPPGLLAERGGGGGVAGRPQTPKSVVFLFHFAHDPHFQFALPFAGKAFRLTRPGDLCLPVPPCRHRHVQERFHSLDILDLIDGFLGQRSSNYSFLHLEPRINTSLATIRSSINCQREESPQCHRIAPVRPRGLRAGARARGAHPRPAGPSRPVPRRRRPSLDSGFLSHLYMDKYG